MAVADQPRTPARRWVGSLGEGYTEIEDQRVDLEVERDEGVPGGIAIHTMIEGTGSYASYYLDRESAIELAVHILLAVKAS